MTYLGLTVNPWWLSALALTPVIAWARIVIKHHTNAEVVAGIGAVSYTHLDVYKRQE